MKILLVEDEIRIAKYIKKGLEQKAHTVDMVHDGQDGYDFATTEDYDIIILDWMLPSMDGLTICEQLRNDGIKVPILMLTAKGEVEDRVSGLETGADDYLIKPFAFAELLARIQALGRRPPQTTNELLQCADLTLNNNTSIVKRGTKTIPLTQKEFALLEYLLRNQNKVISAEQLTTHVWNFDSDILPNTAQVYIGYLRNKIDKPFSNSPALIKTVRGFGYKLGE